MNDAGAAAGARTALLPLAVAADLIYLETAAGRVALYQASPERPVAGLPPLLLVHSVNAAASVAEVAPLFEFERQRRTVVALDLPGYGHSERSDRLYTPRLMTDAVLAAADWLAEQAGSEQVDALGVSLSAEFVVRAQRERPERFRRLALVSPTGFSRAKRRHGPPGSTLMVPWLLRLLQRPGWGDRIFRNLTRPGVIRYFLKRTFGSPSVDEALWAYAVATTRQPGARHAPLHFVSAALFSGDINTLFEAVDCPVWVSMATRGDFTDYQGRTTLADHANWQFHLVEGGALPYFEDLDAFTAKLDPFWTEVT
jgi:pimeloyl-ACP methyl ester carboxylesterase